MSKSRTYLKDYSSVGMLRAWGAWQTSELRQLGYRRVHLQQEGQGMRISALNEDELMVVDKALTKLKTEDLQTFQVLFWRFALRESYRQITQRLHKKSPKVAGQAIDFGVKKFFEKLREVIE